MDRTLIWCVYICYMHFKFTMCHHEAEQGIFL